MLALLPEGTEGRKPSNCAPLPPGVMSQAPRKCISALCGHFPKRKPLGFARLEKVANAGKMGEKAWGQQKVVKRARLQLPGDTAKPV